MKSTVDFRTGILPRIGMILHNAERFIYQDNRIIIVYVPNNRASNCVKQKFLELQGERDKSITVIDFNAPFNNC